MQERRRQPRDRVYYGGMVTFNDRTSNIACVVRNFSMFGARIEFEGAALVPDKVDFEIRRKSISCLAHMVWRDRDAAGRRPVRERSALRAETDRAARFRLGRGGGRRRHDHLGAERRLFEPAIFFAVPSAAISRLESSHFLVVSPVLRAKISARPLLPRESRG